LAADRRPPGTEAASELAEAADVITDDGVLAVSAVTGQGLDRLLRAITRALDRHSVAADTVAVGHSSDKT
jgi:hypothetical protein